MTPTSEPLTLSEANAALKKAIQSGAQGHKASKKTALEGCKINEIYESLEKILIDEAPSESTESETDDALNTISDLNWATQLDIFVKSSESLTQSLDNLGQSFPFILIAVIPFEVALELEKKHKRNDRKVLALFIKMCEMMETLRRLEEIKPAEMSKFAATSKALAKRMEIRLRKAAKAIKQCSEDTQKYYKSKSIVRFFRARKWEKKFIAYEKTFEEILKEFHADIFDYTSVGVQAIRRTGERMDVKISILMMLVFFSFVSPDEGKLLAFIETKGGIGKFMEHADDQLLKELMNESWNSESHSGKGKIRSHKGPGPRHIDLKGQSTSHTPVEGHTLSGITGTGGDTDISVVQNGQPVIVSPKGNDVATGSR